MQTCVRTQAAQITCGSHEWLRGLRAAISIPGLPVISVEGRDFPQGAARLRGKLQESYCLATAAVCWKSGPKPDRRSCLEEADNSFGTQGWLPVEHKILSLWKLTPDQIQERLRNLTMYKRLGQGH